MHAMQIVPSLPEKEEKRLMQAEVNIQLFLAAKKVMDEKGIKIRTVMEWGLKSFLLAYAAEEAKEMGIKTEYPNGDK